MTNFQINIIIVNTERRYNLQRCSAQGAELGHKGGGGG